MLIYLIYVQPWASKKDNMLNIINELILLIAFFSSLLMTLHEFSEGIVMGWGWVLIALAILSLLITWAIIVPEIFKATCGWVNSFLKKKEAENNEDAIEEPKAKKSKSIRNTQGDSKA